MQTLHKDVPNILLDVLHIADSATSVSDQANEDSKERLILGYIVKECEKVILSSGRTHFREMRF